MDTGKASTSPGRPLHPHHARRRGRQPSEALVAILALRSPANRLLQQASEFRGRCMMLKTRFVRSGGIIACLCCFVGALAGQTPVSPAFEVASIKLDKSGS